MAIDPWELILEWWQNYQADPRADAENIESGLRKQQTASKSSFSSTDPAVTSSLQTASCQYWVKGLPNVCAHWDSTNMVCGYRNSSDDIQSSDIPTGSATGGCDGLGRRQWCNRYKAPVDQATGETINYDHEKYACILPCIERSGSGRTIHHEKGIQTVPWAPNEIAGYNPDDKNVGQCDNNGMGRGKEGFTQDFIENLQLLPPICKHYKPHMMGFGAVDPRPYHGNPPSSIWNDGQTYIPRTPKKLHDGSIADPLVMMNKRLPFSFQVYNQRSQFQKCAFWDADFGGAFRFGDYGADPSYFQIQINQKAESYCLLRREGNISVKDYTDIDPDTTNIPWVLQDVWTKGGTVVCNGAKPECPCYTGSWVFCRDRNMQDGMRISADQLFELRFWASDWSSQEEYDKFYEEKPGITHEGFSDVTTADIYTFTKWVQDELTDEVSASDSVMRGSKHHMCMPAPLHMREYDHAAYTSIEPVIYPKHDYYSGTTTKSEVAYPTLVRELASSDNIFPNILVIHPYASMDSWNMTVCNQEDYVEFSYHNHNLMHDKPKISVVGQCVRNSRMWAINVSHEGVLDCLETYSVLNTMRVNTRAQLIPDAQYEFFCRGVEKLIVKADSGGSAGIVEGQTNEYGFFMLEGLELIANGDNEIFIICEFEGGDYPLFVYRYRRVKSKYFGALITQNEFSHKYVGSIWENTTPKMFSPSCTVYGSVSSINGEVASVISCYSFFRPDPLLGDQHYYSYSFNAYSEEEEDLDQWVQVGPTGYIWAELPDINISYLFGFEVIEAFMEPKNSGTEESPKWPSSCGGFENESNIAIELEVVETKRKQIPPSGILLEYKKGGKHRPRAFFNKDWRLRIKYKFVKLESSQALAHNAEDYWPIWNAYGGIHFVNSPYDIIFDVGSADFTITGLGGMASRGTAAVMALVVDQKDGRLQAVAASKMLLTGMRFTCRSIDILYSYMASATVYDLEPAFGFFTWRGSPQVNPSTSQGRSHVTQAPCGDHECGRIGPMWFPFNVCTSDNFYNVLNGAGQCTMPVSEGDASVKVMGNGAWRYCMANEFKSWITPGGNWAAACGTGFYYHYSQANTSTMQFIGWAKKKGKIEKDYYLMYDWALPPFGNTGRNMVERWLFRDYASFSDFSGPKPKISTEYVPLVLDREDFIDDLDAFTYPGISSHPELHEPFSHRSILSTLTAKWINEELVQNERHRFEDIIEVETHSGCMYPWPNLIGYGVARYKFKYENLAWAWPEYWKSIERGVGTDKFKWLELSAPRYLIDGIKKRHRLITDEGLHTIAFKAPIVGNQSGGSDGYGDNSNALDSPDNLAGICLDGPYWRYFKLEYEDYTSGYIEWVDESASGEDDGSGGSGFEEGNYNIYEEANNGTGSEVEESEISKWVHDFDTLFDSDASTGLVADRKVAAGSGFSRFNRGLIAKIPKNRLNQLPMTESNMGVGQLIDGDLSFDTPYGNSAIFVWGANDLKSSATRLVIVGVWGTGGNLSEENLVNLCKPSVSFMEKEGGEMKNVYSRGGRSGWCLSSTGDKKETYTLEAEFSKYPDRLLHPSDYHELTLSPVATEFMQITSVTLYGSNYTTQTEEVVKVWEQKFYVSTLDIGGAANADGPDTKNYRDYARDGRRAGQYLPVEDGDLWNTGAPGNAVSKMVMISAGKYYGVDEDEKIPVTLGNLKTVEADEQKLLYEEAVELDGHAELFFDPVLPPNIAYFIKDVLNISDSLEINACKLKYDIVDWKHNIHKCRFLQNGEFFSPGGHYFKWSDSYFKSRCYISGPIETVYTPVWVHHRHGGPDGGSKTESIPSVGDSYAGVVRLDYYEGRLWQLGVLGFSETGQPTDVLTGAKNQVYERS